ncbi:MAG: Uma2 family endonuclease [Selenomonadaceae bacterium]|nr:Uma2 family endonuclease [Selenomonadaceae bacterium]
MSNLAYKYDASYELIDGRTYMMARPSVNHTRIERNIVGLFNRYLKGKTCESFNETDVYFSEEDNFVPDVIIVCNPDIVEDNGIYGTPDLVVEVASPSTARRDRMEKFYAYEKYGVKEYWIVSPGDKSVEVYLLKDGKFVLDDVYPIYKDYEWDKLTDEEKAEVKFAIKVSLYDDFEVSLADIFEDVK